MRKRKFRYFTGKGTFKEGKGAPLLTFLAPARERERTLRASGSASGHQFPGVPVPAETTTRPLEAVRRGFCFGVPPQETRVSSDVWSVSGKGRKEKEFLYRSDNYIVVVSLISLRLAVNVGRSFSN